MDSFSTWVLRGLNAKQSKSRLLQISDLIDWEPIRHKLDEMYDNTSYKFLYQINRNQIFYKYLLIFFIFVFLEAIVITNLQIRVEALEDNIKRKDV